ncbi:MAG: hypothetical protein ACI4V7_08715 [Succinivibrionaceae bacterium]
MKKVIIATSDLASLKVYKYKNKSIIDCVDDVKQELLKSWEIGDHYANVLAKPVISSDGKSIEWIVPFNINDDSKIVKFNELSFNEKKEIKDDFKIFLSILEIYATSYKITESNSFSRIMIGFLKDPDNIIKFPGILPNTFNGTFESISEWIYVVDNRPVIIGWGTTPKINNSKQQIIQNISSKSVVDSPVNFGNKHKWCFLLGIPLLFILLASLFLLWWFILRPKLITPRQPQQKPIITFPKEESKLVESKVEVKPVPIPPKVEKQKPAPKITPTKSTQKPKVELPKKNDKLDLSKVKNDRNALDGKWVVISDLYNRTDHEPVKVHIDLKGGHGTMTLVEKSGVRCTGPISTSLKKNTLNMYGQNLDCAGTKYSYIKSDIQCKLTESKNTVCNIVNGKNKFDVDVLRE